MDASWFVYVTIILVALVQGPIAVDLLRFFFPDWKLARMASKTVHIILFSVMGIIFCIGLGYHLFVYLPLLAGQQQPLQSFKGLVHIVFALWVWLNVVGNYYYSVSLHPGLDKDYRPSTRRSGKPVLCYISESGVYTEVKEDRHQTENGDTISQRQSDSKMQSDGGEKFYCDSSLVGKKVPPKSGLEWEPNRTHYCKICECAIPYLDHHCPFTGNCAGLKNYAYFITGLSYGVLGLFYAVIITLPYFFECNLNNVLWYFGIVGSRVTNEICSSLGPHTHIFLPVFAGFCLSGNMLFIQFLLLAADLSTYNVLSNWSRFPMLRFMLQRIKKRKYLEKGSRYNVLLKHRRLASYFIPMKPSWCEVTR